MLIKKFFYTLISSVYLIVATPFLALAEDSKSVRVLQGDSSFLSEVLGYISTIWNLTLLDFGGSPITVSKVCVSILLFIVGWILSGFLAKKLLAKALRHVPLKSGAAAAVQSISFYVLLAVFGLLALHIVNIPLTIFTLLGGALAIGVGFGSQNIINNFISGLILLIEQPVRVGDLIEFSGTRGRIHNIGARSTNLLTPDNIEVIVPNSHLLENSVTNWTLTNLNVRRNLTLGVAYGSPTREVSNLMLKAAGEHGSVFSSPAPEVLFKDFGDNSLIFELRFWIEMRQFSDALHIESDIRFMIDSLFKEHGIVIAFPQRDVHFDTHGKPLEVRLISEAKD